MAALTAIQLGEDASPIGRVINEGQQVKVFGMRLSSPITRINSEGRTNPIFSDPPTRSRSSQFSVISLILARCRAISLPHSPQSSARTANRQGLPTGD